jgi:FKBP-type peptidyl-prolyl cis-trans isomerase 2
MKTKKGEIVSIDYVGIIKNENVLFDLTDPSLINKKGKKTPSKIIKLGEGDILPGLDRQLIDKEIGKVYDLEVSQNEAFGKKDPKLIKLLPLDEFKKHKVVPVPGMKIDLDGKITTVRTVGGGRVTLDFNHPLAGKDLLYKIKINKIVTELKEQVTGFVQLAIPNSKVELNKKNITVIIPEEAITEVKDIIVKNLKERFPELQTVKVATKA